MIKLKIERLIHPQFKNSLLGLCGQEMSFGTAIALKHLVERVEKKIIEVEDEKMEIIRKYAPLDENGNIIPAQDEDGKDIPGSVRVPEGDKADLFRNDFIKFLKKEVEIQSQQIDPNALKDTRVTMNDLEFLGPCLKETSSVPSLNLV